VLSHNIVYFKHLQKCNFFNIWRLIFKQWEQFIEIFCIVFRLGFPVFQYDPFFFLLKVQFFVNFKQLLLFVLNAVIDTGIVLLGNVINGIKKRVFIRFCLQKAFKYTMSSLQHDIFVGSSSSTHSVSKIIFVKFYLYTGIIKIPLNIKKVKK
jgi:hypothetical protein